MFSLSGFNSFGVDILAAFKKKDAPILSKILPSVGGGSGSIFKPSFTDKLLFTGFATITAIVLIKALIRD